MKKKVLSIVLALALCLGLLPGTAVAAETDLPEWHFLWAIFKNVDADGKDQDGVMQRAKYTMPQEQIDYVKKVSQEFEEYMNQVGVMRARVEVVVIDETITELGESLYGACLSPKQAAPLLEKSNINLDLYDEVICVVSLNGLKTDYYGLGGSSFENRTGWAAINLINWEYCSNVLADSVFRSGGYVHEFLHFMENISKKWGGVFDIHDIRINFYTPDHDGGKACYMDIMRNCAKGNAGTGVPPAAWQYPPRVLRTIRELDIPFGVASIGNSAFAAHPTLTKVTVPGSVASIEYGAFQDCAGLTEVTFSSGLAQIGKWAFGNCTALTSVVIPDTVISIEYAGFYNNPCLTDVYYGGTEEQWKNIQMDNYSKAELGRAKIHCNSHPEIVAASKTASDIRVEAGRAVGSVTLSVQNNADPSGLSVFIGCYDAQKRLLGVERFDTTVRTGANTLTIPLSGSIKCKNETNLHFRVFLLDGRLSPLCAAVEI